MLFFLAHPIYQFPLFEPLKYYKKPKPSILQIQVYICTRNTPSQNVYQKGGNLANTSLLIIFITPPPPSFTSPPVKIISSPKKLNFQFFQQPFSKNPSPVYYICNFFQPLAFNCLVVDCHNFTSVPGPRITF